MSADRVAHGDGPGRIRRVLRALVEASDRLLDVPFGASNNPLKHLGALGWFFFWIVLASGIYLFIFFDTGIVNAYASVEYMTHEQWYLAGVMRSLHRYASDALIVVLFLHVLRTFMLGQYRGARWFSWVTGIPLIWFIYISGITGYWLVWDELAQYVAIATSEWLDTLGIFGEPLARNFLDSSLLSSRFFTLMVFMHIVVPLVLIFALWLHTQRQSEASVNPPRSLALGTLIALLVTALVFPVASQAPADLDRVVAVVNLDWLYLMVYPLLDRVDGLYLWAGLGAITVALVLVPWLPKRRRVAPALVNLENCNGCERCVADCPFTAISMGPRRDGKPYAQEAVVDTDLCTSCGLCVGACPTAMPFRRVTRLIPGIQLPQENVEALRDDIQNKLGMLSDSEKVLIVGCRHGVRVEELESSTVAAVSLPCVGALPPSFIDFVISRKLADGVVLAGCTDGNCFYRLGQKITEGRLEGTRDPRLRKRVPRERVAVSWVGSSGKRQLKADVAALQARLLQDRLRDSGSQPTSHPEEGSAS